MKFKTCTEQEIEFQAGEYVEILNAIPSFLERCSLVGLTVARRMVALATEEPEREVEPPKRPDTLS